MEARALPGRRLGTIAGPAATRSDAAEAARASSAPRPTSSADQVLASGRTLVPSAVARFHARCG
eukprot:1577681-Pyramimonas_sp.AAC.1